MTTPSEVPERVDLKNLRAGSLIDIETKSRHYLIECLGGDIIRISGHPEYCPQPVQAHLEGVIERGRRMKFLLNDDCPVTTTRIVSLHVAPPTAGPLKSSPSMN
jgi:hypothetical protein